jgi:hypothetical protein
MPLDETELEELRRWGHALREARSEESVAAGRAILMLLDELERLRLELRLAGSRPGGTSQVASSKIEAVPNQPVSSALHGRLRRALGDDGDRSLSGSPEPVEKSDPTEAALARSWIETLRRQN